MSSDFKLTPDFVFNLLEQAAAGNPVPLTEALDPEVKWRIGSEKQDNVAKTGIYVSLNVLKASSKPLVISLLHSS